MKDRYQPPPSAREGVRYQAPPSAADQASAEPKGSHVLVHKQLLAQLTARADAEDRAALVEQAAHYKREAARLTAALATAEARTRTELSRVDLAEAENERLRAECEKSNRAHVDTHADAQRYFRRAEAAESRLATLIAENERLRAQCRELGDALADEERENLQMHTELDAAEARLATAEAAAAKALTLLARAQDGSPKTPREANSHSVQLDYEIGQLLQSEGWVWDAINRRWTEAETGSATWTEYRGRQP